MKNIAFISTAHVHSQGFLTKLADRDGENTIHRIWDDMESRGRQRAEEFQTEYTSDLDGLLADDAVDGFVICAENTRHLPLLEKVLPVGKPVMCEKPLVTNREDLAAVRKLTDKHGDTPLFCGYVQPFTAAMQKVRQLVNDRAFGDITRVRFRNAHHAAYGRWFDSAEKKWFHDPALSGGGALMDMGTHAVHLLRTLFGPVTEVWATVENHSGIYDAVDDYGVAHLRFGSGTWGTVEAAWTQTGGTGGLEIVGSDAALWRNGGSYVRGVPRQQAEPIGEASAVPDRIDRLFAVIDGKVSREELAADLDAICDSVAIMAAAYESSASNRWVAV